MTVDGRRERGDRSRRHLLSEAAAMASVEGLEGLSIGKLSQACGVSKAGVFGLFGSKEGLQLATVEEATGIFTAAVVTPVLADTVPGRDRVWALCRSWIAYARDGVFPGGCFFLAAAVDFDGRPGPVRDRLAESRRAWLGVYEQAIAEAQAAGEIDAAVDPAQLAFELDAMAMAANVHTQLCGGGGEAFERALTAMAGRLGVTTSRTGPADQRPEHVAVRGGDRR